MQGKRSKARGGVHGYMMTMRECGHMFIRSYVGGNTNISSVDTSNANVCSVGECGASNVCSHGYFYSGVVEF
jgi:hypothetical protein